MYEIGDKVFIKNFGSGIINTIEEKNIDGVIKKYYGIELRSNGMHIFLPVDDEEKLRKIILMKDVDVVFKILNSSKEKLPEKALERYKVYKNTLLTNDIFEYAKILKAIADKYNSKKLPKLELKVMKELLNLICSEVSLTLEEEFNVTKKKIIEVINFKNYK